MDISSHIILDFCDACRSFIVIRLSVNGTVTSENASRNNKYNFVAIKNGK